MQSREMKKILDAQKEKTLAKKHVFENLNMKLLDLQRLISLNSTVSSMQSRCGSLLVQRSMFNFKIGRSEGEFRVKEEFRV